MPGHLRRDWKYQRAGSPSFPLFFCLLMLLAQLFIPGGAALAAGAESTLDLPKNEFRPVPTDYPVTNAVIAEDGKHVVIAHENDNLLSVWELPALRPVKEIPCPCPHFLLSLQGRLYVANYDTGTVSVYSQDNWQLVDQLQSGCNKLFYLSAPQGKHFAGIIIANGYNLSANGQYSVEVRAINTADDTNRLLAKQSRPSFPTVDFRGEGLLNFSESGTGLAFKYQDVLKGADELPHPETTTFYVGKTEQIVLYQPTAAPFWFSCNGAATAEFLFQGTPPKPVNLLRGQFIPDLNGQYAYAFCNGEFCTIRLDTLTIENRCQSTAFAALRKNFSYELDSIRFPAAISQGGDAYLLMVIPPQLYLGVFVNVIPPSSAVRLDPPGNAQGGQVGPGEPTARPSEPSSLQDSVRKATVGEALAIPVMPGGPPQAAFTLVNGPDNASVSDSGIFSWTPAASQTGQHHIKIRAKTESATTFIRFVIEVAPGGSGTGKTP